MFIALNHQNLSELQIILYSPDENSVIVWTKIAALTIMLII